MFESAVKQLAVVILVQRLCFIHDFGDELQEIPEVIQAVDYHFGGELVIVLLGCA